MGPVSGAGSAPLDAAAVAAAVIAALLRTAWARPAPGRARPHPVRWTTTMSASPVSWAARNQGR